MRTRFSCSPLLVTALVAVAASSAPAQTVRGRVVDGLTGEGVAGATVVLLDRTWVRVANGESDSSGAFHLRPPAPGSYRVWLSRPGYRTLTGEEFEVASGGDVEVTLELTIEPVAMPEVRAVAEARDPRLAEAGFYERRDHGVGYFLDREGIEARGSTRVIDLFRNLGDARVIAVNSAVGEFDVVMRGGGSQSLTGATCYPAVVVDGAVVRRGGQGEAGRWHEVISPRDIAAIEVYPSSGGAPARYTGSASPCGTILIWTRG